MVVIHFRKEPKPRKNRKAQTVACDSTGPEDTTESDELSSARSTRSTRSTRSAKSSQSASQRSTRSTRSTRKNLKSVDEEVKGEPILAIVTDTIIEQEQEIETNSSMQSESPDAPMDLNHAQEPIVIDTCDSNAEDASSGEKGEISENDQSPQSPISAVLRKTPTPKPQGSEVSSPKPIPGFRLLSVKDKAQAFESLSNVSSADTSDITSTTAVSSNDEQDSFHQPGQIRDETPKFMDTPVSKMPDISPTTPDTVIAEPGTPTLPVTRSAKKNKLEPNLDEVIVEDSEDMSDAEPSPSNYTLSPEERDRKSQRQPGAKARLSLGYRTSLSKRRSSIMRHKLAAAAKLSSAKKPSEAVARLNESLASMMKVKVM